MTNSHLFIALVWSSVLPALYLWPIIVYLVKLPVGYITDSYVEFKYYDIGEKLDKNLSLKVFFIAGGFLCFWDSIVFVTTLSGKAREDFNLPILWLNGAFLLIILFYFLARGLRFVVRLSKACHQTASFTHSHEDGKIKNIKTRPVEW